VKGLHKVQILICGFLIISVLVAGCSVRKNGDLIPLESLGPGEGQVNIIAWDGYMERGDTDENFDWVTEFEITTGCDVQVETASSSDEMVALLSRGEYDLVTASSDAATRLIANGALQPINVDLLPSWDMVDTRFKESSWHTVNGIHYGVPFLWTANRLIFDNSVFTNPPQSVGVTFFEQQLPDGLSNKGRLQAFEGAMAIADAALYLMQTHPELDIRDPYELNRVQFGEVISLLRGQRELLSGYWADASDQVESFLEDDNAVAIAWPYQAQVLERMGNQVDSLIPPEKITGRAETFMMHSNAQHPNCSYFWMEHILDPRVQGNAAAWTGSNPSVIGACEASEFLGDAGCEQNGYFRYEDVYFWKTPMENCGDGRMDCVPYSDWVTAYISLIGGQ
jgi:putative spermidine/putrescine transport system substrate-binding protein